MTLDRRGRRAGEGFRHAIDDLAGTDPARGSFERFAAFRHRKQRNQRIGAALVAGAVAFLAIAFAARAVPDGKRDTATLPGGGGRILYSDWDAQAQRADWRTVSSDGSSSRDLDLSATCAIWLPSGSQILVTNDGAVGPRSPLRPAIVEPDGSGLRPLDATRIRTSTWAAATCLRMVAGSRSKDSVRTVTPSSTASTRSAPRTVAVSSGWSEGLSRRRGTRRTALALASSIPRRE